MATPDENTFKNYQTLFGVDKNTGAITNFMLNSETVDTYQRSEIIYQ